ncbi:MAG: FAD-dependent oxidoreductase [Pseudanabaenaceae cyanobacterium bins.68]|nr:FAD-dependent oxidoreductase [Pseudanabaenaceae cyanobacterium bins.68]
MKQVWILGAGVVGLTLAYWLSKAGLEVTVWEASQPGSGGSGAALGVMMAAASLKLKGSLAALRLQSLAMYEWLVPELEAVTGIPIFYNRSGILCLYRTQPKKLAELIATRQAQGYELVWLSQRELRSRYGEIEAEGGLYSPSDRMIDPRGLIAALVAALNQRGVSWRGELQDVDRSADWVVITAGIGSDRWLSKLGYRESLVGVQGQALELVLPGFNLPIPIHGEMAAGGDFNLVPVGKGKFWLGATLEFAADQGLLPLENLRASAELVCPGLVKAEVLASWSGVRARPQGRRSPILGFVPGHPGWLVATGHYRNGILMAPITAEISRDLILTGDSSYPWQDFSLEAGIA